MYTVRQKHLFECAITGPTNCTVKSLLAMRTARQLQTQLNKTYQYAYELTNKKSVGELVPIIQCDTSLLTFSGLDGWKWDRKSIGSLVSFSVFAVGSTETRKDENKAWQQLKKDNKINIPFHDELIDAFIAGAKDGHEMKKKEVTATAAQGIEDQLEELHTTFGEKLSYTADKDGQILLHFPFGNDSEDIIASGLECAGGITFYAKNASEDSEKIRITLKIPITKESPAWIRKRDEDRLHRRLDKLALRKEHLIIIAMDSFSRKHGLPIEQMGEQALDNLLHAAPKEVLSCLEPHKGAFISCLGQACWNDFKTKAEQINMSKDSLHTSTESQEIDLF